MVFGVVHQRDVFFVAGMSMFLTHLLLLTSPPLYFKKYIWNIKQQAYGQHVHDASFIPKLFYMPLVHNATIFYKQLASTLSLKWGDEYSVVS